MLPFKGQNVSSWNQGDDDLINSYLSNREQYTVINNTKSSSHPIDYGTPQGSTLGPLLFLIFINDIFKLKLNGKIVMFADDAALNYSSTDLDELHRMMSEDIATLCNWLEANKLTLNINKSKFMLIHPKQTSKKFTFDLQVNNTPIEQVDSFEYLGLTIQDNLHWNHHISKISTKMSRISGVVNRLGNNVNRKFLISIYYAHIQSHLSYMSPIWGHAATNYQINALQISQNQAIRSIFREQYYAQKMSTADIRKSHRIFSVQQIIKYDTATLAYKTKKKLIKTDITLNPVSDRHNYNTRSSGNIYEDSFRTNAGKYSIGRMIAVEFNNLPTSIKDCNSHYTFKKKLKTFTLQN